MIPTKIHLLYFSATGTTKKIMNSIADSLGASDVEVHDLFKTQPEEEVCIPAKDLVIFGMPVYAGRIPAMAARALAKFKGDTTPAITVVTYGNREYDDALLELKNTTEGNGFRVVSAAAFVAQHSIFPAIATGRPDTIDIKVVREFVAKSKALLEDPSRLSAIQVKGNIPYKEAKAIPLNPRGNRYCNECGACAKACPVRAIDPNHPKRTNKDRCIACAHCISICPQNARHFRGFKYKLVSKKFFKAFGGIRKEPELFYSSLLS